MTPLPPCVVSNPRTCLSRRADMPRIRARSISEPRSAKQAKLRAHIAQLATPSARTATVNSDYPMRGPTSSLAATEGRTSEVSTAKRIRVAPSTVRACLTSHTMANIESAKRLDLSPPAPRNINLS